MSRVLGIEQPDFHSISLHKDTEVDLQAESNFNFKQFYQPCWLWVDGWLGGGGGAGAQMTK